MSQLSTEIDTTLAILSRGSEGIEAVMNGGSETNRFRRALDDLQRLAVERSIPIAIVGGLGAIRYGYPAATQDIHVAVGREHLGSLVRFAPHYGFAIAWNSESGWHTLTHGDVEINVVPEGGKARDTAPTEIPSPIQMGVVAGLDYAALESWMELKVSSGRQKDRAHIVEVLKKSDDASIARIGQHLKSIHASYYELFEQLLAEALAEKQQEQKRR